MRTRVFLANIMYDKHRATSRTGLGAVMGSKKLKAIVVAGDHQTQVANTEEY